MTKTKKFAIIGLMSTKTKTNNLTAISAQVGLLLMSTAATLGMVELPDHLRGQVAVTSQPAFVFANNTSDKNNPVRRERDETAPHYISYNVSQRTPARSGKR